MLSTLGTVGIAPVRAAKSGALSGKTALFVGDSIMAGWRDSIDGRDMANGRGWGYRIRDNCGMTVNIAASAGQALSTVRDGYMSPIYKQLENNRFGNYDYVILEGGFNDIMGNEKSDAKETAPLGTISTSYNIQDFDRSTFASGLEHLLCYATTAFPNAKIGFIVTFETPYSRRGNGTADRETTKQYFDLAKQICDKWNVPYLDFYDGSAADGTKYFDVFYPEGRTLVSNYPNGISGSDVLQRIKDDIHPNAAGYDASYEYIAAWMETLSAYRSPVPTTAKPTTTTTVDSVTTTVADKVNDSDAVITTTDTATTTSAQDKTTTDDYAEYITVFERSDITVMVKPDSHLTDAEFSVEWHKSGAVYDAVANVLKNTCSQMTVYAVDAVIGGETAKADSRYVLRLPIPDGYPTNKIKVVRLVDDNSYEVIAASIDAPSGTISLQTKRFGTFAIIETDESHDVSDGIGIWTYVLIGAACAVALAVLALLIVLLIKKNKLM